MNRASDKLWSIPEWTAPRWGNRRGRPWTQFEIDLATAMRFRGAKDEDISIKLMRSVKSIIGKIGYQRGRA